MGLIKKSRIWAIIFFLLSLFLAVFLERFIATPRLFKSAIFELIDKQNQQLVIDDFSIVGYKVDENKLSVTPEMQNQLLYSKVNRRVGTITVYFGQPLDQEISASLYYSQPWIDFNDDMKVMMVGHKNESKITFLVNRNVSSIRLDIGQQKDQFVLSKVCINENFRSIQDLINGAVQPFALSRSSFFFIILMFMSLHFLLDLKRMYTFLFRYRYAVAAGLFLFLALQEYHGTSIGMYGQMVQPGTGSEFVSPVLGEIRAIRSDEWAVSTPWKLAATYGEDAFGKYNYIMRATQTVNMGTSGLYLSYAALGNIPTYFIMIFGIKGFGAYWYFTLFACFLATFEMCRILCKDNKWFSLVGAFLITFSAYFQWWSYVIWLIYGQAIIVCFFHYIKSDRWWQRILLTLGIGLSGAAFICCLYPAWLVPAAYLFLIVFIWIIADNWKTVKKLNWKKWSVFAAGVLFGISIVWAFLDANNEYIQAISNTVYPGARASQGGFSLDSIYKYVLSPLLPYRDFGNPSEAGKFFSLFPVPMVMGIYVWFKSKSKDLLLTLLLGYSIFLTLYTTTGIPMFISKITLMSYSTHQRALNILDFIQIYLLLMVMTRYKDEAKMKTWVGLFLSVCFTGIAILVADTFVQAYLPLWYALVIFVVIVFLSYGVFCKIDLKLERIICFLLIAISLVTGLLVNPVQKGFDTIYSKPVAKEIKEIVEKDNEGKWIVVDQRWLPGFLISCGAPTINSVHNYPDMELWRKLELDNEYNDLYNRFAHIEIILYDEDTTPELIHADAIRLYLSYKDLQKIDVKYILVQHEIESKHGIDFDLIYSEHGFYIYEVDYS